MPKPRLPLVLLAVCALACPAPSSAGTVLTTEQWRADLRFLAEELPKRHRNAFFKTPRADFERAVAELDAKIPSLQDHEVLVGLVRLVAMLGDGHSRITLPVAPDVAFDRTHTTTPPVNDLRLALHHLPVRIASFPEGLFIRSATPAHRDLIGSRVLEIGKEPAEAALQKVRAVVHADNEMGFRLFAPTRLTIPEILHAQGVSDDPRRTRLVLEDPAGRRREVVLDPLDPAPAPVPIFVEAREVAPQPVPLWERNLQQAWWLEVLKPSRTLYVQINQVNDAGAESLASFARRIEENLATPVDRLVLDLRHNPGGDNSLNRSLLLAVLRNEKIDRFGHFFVLIGRETFSAAQSLVNDLEHLSSALFVGEPTGSSPSAYGDSRKFQLPHSGLTVRASSVYWRDWSADETRPWTAPDLAIEITARDCFANRDPVLEEVLRFSPGDLSGLAAAVARSGGLGGAFRLLYRLDTDPRHAELATEPLMIAAGAAFLKSGKAKEAASWYRETVRRHSASAPAHLGLGRALLLTGDQEGARKELEEALRLDPASAEAKELLEVSRR